MKIRINPYDRFSRGAKLLAQALTDKLGYKVFRGPEKAKRVNYQWGDPHAIAANKLTAFQAFTEAGVPCPEWTTAKPTAQQWIENGAVIVRKVLRGSEGRGAVYVPKNGDLPDAPLFVKYIAKKKEYRVHVMQDTVILVQEKRKRSGIKADPKIRNHGDWVFCTKGIEEPEDLRDVAIKAAQAAYNGYGAVDIVYNQKRNKCYALEVNTAPGLTPSTAKVYADAIVSKWGNLL